MCTFLYSSSSPPAPARSAAAATKKSPSARVVKKQAFILHVLLTVTAWRHSLAKVIMKQIKSQTQASLFPTPQESQHCTKLYLQGKQSEMASPKNPLAIQKKTFKTSVTVNTLHTAGFPLAAPWTSISPEQVTTGYQEEPGNPESCHSSFLSFSKTLGNHKPHLTQQRLSWICPRELSARHPGTPQSEREDKEMGLRVSWHSALGTSQERIALARSWNLRSLHIGSRMCWET